MRFDPRRTGLIVELMQNDNVSRDGVYARHGLPPDAIEAILPHLQRVCAACRANRLAIIATQMTILTDLDGKAMGHDLVAAHRPFLNDEGLRAGTWGHEITPELPQPDYQVRKWVFSSFYQSELEHILRALKLSHLVFVGEATHIAVESTARDALIRNYDVTILSDCVASYERPFHESSLVTLSDIARVMTSTEFLAGL